MKSNQMAPSELDLFEPRLNRFIPHRPTPRQAAFLLLECLEAFYGGAGGGGKSDALFMSGLQYVDVRGYHALIIRRNLSDLAMPNALMDRSHAWLDRRNDARWDESRKRWTFASGATLTFGFLDTARDIDRYASAEFGFIGVDEVTQFPEKQYLDLFARLRAPACPRCGLDHDYKQHRETFHQQQTGHCPTCIDLERQQLNAAHLQAAHIPLRMRSASNPGNVGHDWVKRDSLRVSVPPPANGSSSRRGSTTIPTLTATSTSNRCSISTRLRVPVSSTAIGRRARCAACSSANGWR